MWGEGSLQRVGGTLLMEYSTLTPDHSAFHLHRQAHGIWLQQSAGTSDRHCGWVLLPELWSEEAGDVLRTPQAYQGGPLRPCPAPYRYAQGSEGKSAGVGSGPLQEICDLYVWGQDAKRNYIPSVSWLTGQNSSILTHPRCSSLWSLHIANSPFYCSGRSDN